MFFWPSFPVSVSSRNAALGASIFNSCDLGAGLDLPGFPHFKLMACLIDTIACDSSCNLAYVVFIFSSGQEVYLHQLFMDKDEKVNLPTTQQLLELSFLQADIKLSQVNPADSF